MSIGYVFLVAASTSAHQHHGHSGFVLGCSGPASATQCGRLHSIQSLVAAAVKVFWRVLVLCYARPQCRLSVLPVLLYCLYRLCCSVVGRSHWYHWQYHCRRYLCCHLLSGIHKLVLGTWGYVGQHCEGLIARVYAQQQHEALWQHESHMMVAVVWQCAHSCHSGVYLQRPQLYKHTLCRKCRHRWQEPRPTS
jgi:hypothetical protein